MDPATQAATPAPSATSHRTHGQGQTPPTADPSAQTAGFGGLGLAVGITAVVSPSAWNALATVVLLSED